MMTLISYSAILISAWSEELLLDYVSILKHELKSGFSNNSTKYYLIHHVFRSLSLVYIFCDDLDLIRFMVDSLRVVSRTTNDILLLSTLINFFEYTLDHHMVYRLADHPRIIDLLRK